MEFRKGQDLVIAAFRRFHESHPDALLVTTWASPYGQYARTFAWSEWVKSPPPMSSDKRPNIDRWVAQFDPKGRSVKLTQGKSKQGDYVVATISGTFNMPVGPPMGGKSRPVDNAQVVGVIVMNDTGPYFLKMWGQQKTVEKAGKNLRKALGARGGEKPYKG